MGENDSFSFTVISNLTEDDNANEFIKYEESSQEIKPDDESSQKIEPSTDELERKHFQRIVHAFRSYKPVCVEGVRRSLLHLSSLPLRHQQLLKNYRRHLEEVREAVYHNHEVVEIILEDVAHLFHNADHTHDTKEVVDEGVERADIGKVCSVFRQLFREWSAEGKEERDASFQPILQEINARFPRTQGDPSSIHILVPGAGLGRLPYEIAKMGYSCQGNEFSLFMLFTSNFVLNKCQGVNLHSVYPWAHQPQNNVRSEDQLEMILFPDVDPSELTTNPKLEFSMAAGSFLEIYKIPDAWDCLATCFFIDTAHNVVDYIETIWDILRPGGYWINLGPLLYHHTDLPNEDSVEPSYEEIKYILVEFGFKILKEKLDLPTPYSQNPRSMMRHEYRSVFFVCQKPHAHSTP